MHLSGEANAGNVTAIQGGSTEDLADSQNTGSPPVGRRLLCPAWVGNRERLVIFGDRGQQLASFIDDQRACAAGSYVNAKEFDRPSSMRSA